MVVENVRHAHKFDVQSLQRYLQQNYSSLKNFTNYTTITRVDQCKTGQSNPTFIITTSTTKFVLRKKPPGKLLPSAHAVCCS